MYYFPQGVWSKLSVKAFKLRVPNSTQPHMVLGMPSLLCLKRSLTHVLMHKWQHLKVRFRKIGADHCFIKMCASLITDKSVFSFRCCSIRWWVVEGVFLENLKNVCKWPHFVNKLLKLLLAYASFCYSFGFFRVFVHTHIHTYIYFSVCKVPWDDFWFGTIQKIKIDWLSECHSLALRPQQNRGDQMICQCKRNIYLQKWSIHTRKAC